MHSVPIRVYRIGKTTAKATRGGYSLGAQVLRKWGIARLVLQAQQDLLDAILDVSLSTKGPKKGSALN